MNTQEMIKKKRQGHGVKETRPLDADSAPLPSGFGRMFPNTMQSHWQTDPVLQPLDKVAVNNRMTLIGGGNGTPGIMEEPGDNPVGDSNMPAGYTFLGQFIDHDITFDPVSELTDDPRVVDAVNNFRTLGLDLDSVYGVPRGLYGPGVAPHLYRQGGENEGELLTGTASEKLKLFPDLPRNQENTALLGDPRNDENLVVSQLHTAFLYFHNAIVKRLRDAGHAKDTQLVRKARSVVTWYYHKLIIDDFLPRIIGQGSVDDLLANGNAYFEDDMTFMPVEFSVAAFRYGHSQVRQGYRYNDDAAVADIFALGASEQRKPKTYVQWRHFFDLGGGRPPAQRARRIDTLLPNRLINLPAAIFSPNGEPASLATRNLQRGRVFGLPSGQTIANAMAANAAVTNPVPVLGPPANWPAGSMDETPLWYYILQEAQELHNGNQLGPVGGRIVGEVLCSLMRRNADSSLNVAAPPHGIVLPDSAGRFRAPDLLRVAFPQPQNVIDYRVKYGDTLSRIAARFGTTWQVIFNMNRNTINDPDVIYAGQVIKVPVKSGRWIWPLA